MVAVVVAMLAVFSFVIDCSWCCRSFLNIACIWCCVGEDVFGVLYRSENELVGEVRRREKKRIDRAHTLN